MNAPANIKPADIKARQAARRADIAANINRAVEMLNRLSAGIEAGDEEYHWLRAADALRFVFPDVDFSECMAISRSELNIDAEGFPMDDYGERTAADREWIPFTRLSVARQIGGAL